jgi:hypothetical protein
MFFDWLSPRLRSSLRHSILAVLLSWGGLGCDSSTPSIPSDESLAGLTRNLRGWVIPTAGVVDDDRLTIALLNYGIGTDYERQRVHIATLDRASGRWSLETLARTEAEAAPALHRDADGTVHAILGRYRHNFYPRFYSLQHSVRRPGGTWSAPLRSGEATTESVENTLERNYPCR